MTVQGTFNSGWKLIQDAGITFRPIVSPYVPAIPVRVPCLSWNHSPPRILVKNLVQMKNRSGGGATTKSKGKRTGPHGSSRPKRHEKGLTPIEFFLGVRDIHGIPR